MSSTTTTTVTATATQTTSVGPYTLSATPLAMATSTSSASVNPSTSGDTSTSIPTSGTPTPTPTTTTPAPSSARVRFDAECVLIPDLGLGTGGSKRPRMVTKSYSLPLWRKPGHNHGGGGGGEEEHVVLKVALPRSVFFSHILHFDCSALRSLFISLSSFFVPFYIFHSFLCFPLRLFAPRWHEPTLAAITPPPRVTPPIMAPCQISPNDVRPASLRDRTRRDIGSSIPAHGRECCRAESSGIATAPDMAEARVPRTLPFLPCFLSGILPRRLCVLLRLPLGLAGTGVLLGCGLAGGGWRMARIGSRRAVLPWLLGLAAHPVLFAVLMIALALALARRFRPHLSPRRLWSGRWR
ncbi:hypothetical protein DFH06DRAFT_1331717 [Mycena polygramma]|nr:hypothetical protein DFH06DRAFT_1331717 [Mycena polygramma]